MFRKCQIAKKYQTVLKKNGSDRRSVSDKQFCSKKTFKAHIPPTALLFCCFKRFRLKIFVGVSSLPCFEFFWLGNCSWALKWLLTCLSKPPWEVNRIPQPSTMHRKGLSPLCVNICWSSQDFERDGLSYTLQPFHRHTFSFPFWLDTWQARMWSIISDVTSSQPFHWHSTCAGASFDGVTSPFPAGLPTGLIAGLGAVALIEMGVHERDGSGVNGTSPFEPVMGTSPLLAVMGTRPFVPETGTSPFEPVMGTRPFVPVTGTRPFALLTSNSAISSGWGTLKWNTKLFLWISYNTV